MEITYVMDPKTFIDFVYPEARDLCKHFLTLVSGILVFSVTFSEKVVNFQAASVSARWLLFCAWAMFLIAFVGGGASLTMLFLAAGSANAGETSWAQFMVSGGVTLFASGVAFCLGLITLAVSGSLAVLQNRSKRSSA